MKRLGDILVSRGAVSKDQLQSALAACKRHGGRLGTWLVRLGHIGESTLLEALAEQSGVQSVSAFELASAGSQVRALLPATFAKRHMVVPFARRGRNLDVAMATPNDLVLVDEVASLTGLVVRAHVATEAALAAALAIPLTVAGSGDGGPAPGPPTGTARTWRQFWRLESGTQELSRAARVPGTALPDSLSACFPGLEPLDEPLPESGTADLVELAETLRVTSRRDDVARAMLRFLARLAPRAALFSLHQGRVMGWAASGEGIVEEDFHTLMLPVDRPSVFLNLSRGVDVHVGDIGDMEGNLILQQALGAPRAAQAVVVPVRVRGKVIAFTWLDAGDQDVSTLPVAQVKEAARLAGLALEVVLLRQKIKTAGDLTERREAH